MKKENPSWKKLLLLALPIGIVSTMYITIKTHILWLDGPDIYVYGLPFTWVTQSTWVNSLERQYYISGLVPDVLIHTSFYSVLFYFGFRRKGFKHYRKIVITIWIISFLLFLPVLLEAYVCGWYANWSIYDYSVISRQFYLGIH